MNKANTIKAGVGFCRTFILQSMQISCSMVPKSLLLLVSLIHLVSGSGQRCNGYADLCDRSYGVWLKHRRPHLINLQNITFIGAHDSAFYSRLSIVVSADQHYDVTRQLDDGIRLLQSQGHLSPSPLLYEGIRLCHTSCALFVWVAVNWN